MTFKFTITIQVGFIDKRRLLVYIQDRDISSQSVTPYAFSNNFGIEIFFHTQDRTPLS